MFLTVVLTHFSLFLSFLVPQVVTWGYKLSKFRHQIWNPGYFLHPIHMLLNVSLFFSSPGCWYTGVQAIAKWFSDLGSWRFSASNTYVAQCFSLLMLPVSHCFSHFQFPRLLSHQGYKLFKNRHHIWNPGSFLHPINVLLNVSHCCPYLFLTVSLFFSSPGCWYTGVQAIAKWFPDSDSKRFSASNTCVAQCFSLLTSPVFHCFSLFQFPRLLIDRSTSYPNLDTIFGVPRVFFIQYMLLNVSPCWLYLFLTVSLFSVP